MGAPTKKRGSAPSGVASSGPAESACACVSAPDSDGICDLSVWLGTTIDPTAAQSHQRLLRPGLPVVKYKHWSLLTLSGAAYESIRGHRMHKPTLVMAQERCTIWSSWGGCRC